MGIKSKGRGTAGAFGMLLLLVGLAGAAVLWVMSIQRPDRAVDDFARGPVGCTVTLEFSETGTFFVYEELVAPDNEVFASCEPLPVEGVPFGFDIIADGRKVALRDDTSISYDTDTAVGVSVARVEIVSPGRYELVVRGSDPSVVAAVGRAPDDGVSDLQRGAIGVGAAGIVLGGLMLLLAGRRSSKAATYAVPEGPGWGPEERGMPSPASWPPEPPRIRQPQVNPFQMSDDDASTFSSLAVPEPDDAMPPAQESVVAPGPAESSSPSEPDGDAPDATTMWSAAPEGAEPVNPEPDAETPAWAPPPDGVAAAPLPPPTQTTTDDSEPSPDR